MLALHITCKVRADQSQDVHASLSAALPRYVLTHWFMSSTSNTCCRRLLFGSIYQSWIQEIFNNIVFVSRPIKLSGSKATGTIALPLRSRYQFFCVQRRSRKMISTGSSCEHIFWCICFKYLEDYDELQRFPVPRFAMIKRADTVQPALVISSCLKLIRLSTGGSLYIRCSERKIPKGRQKDL